MQSRFKCSGYSELKSSCPLDQGDLTVSDYRAFPSSAQSRREEGKAAGKRRDGAHLESQ